MCGFVGFSGKCDNKQEVISKMLDKIVHRGPDSQESYVDDDIAFGFARLSIIDLEHGTQPLFNEDKSLVLIFNGEIYNYQDLRKDLIEKGHIFETQSDSEVLVHGYEEYKTELPNKLRGMFAFTLWDKKENKLFGCRDFFGIKPYYYAKMNDTFFFGSEIKSFLPHPNFKKELNEEKLPDYLTFSCVPGYDTFFKNVYKLAPGHYYEYQNGEMKITRYFTPEFDMDETKPEEYFVDEISKTFKESVAAHKISDVEVGCFLSSGVDSSYVACELSKLQDVKTYTIGFDDARYSEAPDAKMLADELHVENFEKRVSSEEYFANVGNVQYHLDEPLANPSANLLYFVSQRAAEDLKVVLSGEGADEMFGGYNVYKEPLAIAKYQHKVPKFLRKMAAGIVKPMPEFKGRQFIIRGSQPIEERYIGNSNLFKQGERDQYLKNHYDSKAPQFYTKPFYDKVKNLDDITKMQYMDIHVWMVQEILLKADKMSMAHSLELRVPFLDKEIFNVARTIPVKYKVSEANTKLAMRKAANREINPISANRKKMAFPLPLVEWLREDRYYNIVKKYFNNDTAKKYFNTDKVIELLEIHKAGKHNHARKIWAIFTFLIWHEQFFEGVRD
ncbi:asparagine synthase (glutamine-hydrolyzing) [Paludicola sp. MB14-C6]|uniref:asparagine synthase (glutamine-hydrolyzing) n=1 Tax=Paludihabitans sp. MB14-C6 TaxID=3070656 RepID=UPI0027DE60D4|nr:asparagine synthase (glutamine-hydrolyzing) [Paludicola sp. MB14-C6]WMJ24373.1 asparagine synthase (glutamine-hydrolyzing) [Paludicola sp. MB14-C6]